MVDHEKWLNNLYRHSGYKPQRIFNLKTPFRMDSEAEKHALLTANNGGINLNSKAADRRKRKKNPCINQHENENVQHISSALLHVLDQDPPLLEAVPTDANIIRENNQSVRLLVKKLDSDCVGQPFSGSNASHDTVDLRIIQGKTFLIPPLTSYMCGDILDLKSRLQGQPDADSKYDIILMDPPWENKHISRLQKRQKATTSANTPSGYITMSSNTLFDSLPIKELLSEAGIVIVWCTNAQRHIESLKSAVENAWGLRISAQWFWLKVTRSGEPVTPLDPRQSKLPYERILLVERVPSDPVVKSDGRVIISVPSAIHSHKPPLDEILSDLGLLKNRGKRLELFARYLMPNWTSFGNQVLKLQERQYFIE